ncbi:uncharacterized protein CEXT_74061 [Caerostris extrusa]|uniref:Uncharacterized protein n=1 Tax=Caerostris extrusa TaxID=172846 RepID=A0AAV4XWQ4_CAEEX|nr:uncharacterized protein CEXT_74061 [Caerostris extrusa]
MAACVCRIMSNPFSEPSGTVVKQFCPKTKCQELLPEYKCSEKPLTTYCRRVLSSRKVWEAALVMLLTNGLSVMWNSLYAVFARTSDCINNHNDNHCVCLSGNVRRLREKCEEHLPKCECYELFELNNVGTICQNVSDFEAFGHILSSGSVFEVNTILHIRINGNTVLPKGFLSGVVVAEFHLNDFQTQVEEGAFDEVLELRYIYISRSSMKEIPDFGAISSILSDLRLDNSCLTQLRGDNLKNMTELYLLSLVNNSIEHVAEDVFQVRTPLPLPISSFSFFLQVRKFPSALSSTFSSVPTVQTGLPPPLCRLHKLIFLLLVLQRFFYPSLLIEKRAEKILQTQ